jgi:hypothetical protein
MPSLKMLLRLVRMGKALGALDHGGIEIAADRRDAVQAVADLWASGPCPTPDRGGVDLAVDRYHQVVVAKLLPRQPRSNRAEVDADHVAL